jgi:hypothetical protein
MTQEELTAALAASPSPDRVTPEYFRSRIAKTEFHRIAGGTLTICVLTIDNGFQVTGQSACADPANYKQDIGEKIASDNAERNLWPLLGFLVCEGIYRRNAVPPAAYRDRVRQEREELAAKLVRLRQFIAKDSRADNHMRDQADAMSDYLDALDRRIAGFAE